MDLCNGDLEDLVGITFASFVPGGIIQLRRMPGHHVRAAGEDGAEPGGSAGEEDY